MLPRHYNYLAISFIAILSIGSLLMSSISLAQPNTIKTWLHTERDTDSLLIQPYASSQTPTTIRYHFIGSKTGRSGTAINRSSGSKLVGPEATPLATLRIGLHSNDQLQIQVQIYHNKELIQTLHYP